MQNLQKVRRRYRTVMLLFIAGLVLSGLTAFPLLLELNILVTLTGGNPPDGEGLAWWILHVRDGLAESYARYPWIAYGTDWLAFGHLVIALFFVGPLRDPVRNEWIVTAGLIACGGILPLALICGQIRGIPFYWRLVDCSFGVFGAIPLLYCRHLAQKLAAQAP